MAVSFPLRAVLGEANTFQDRVKWAGGREVGFRSYRLKSTKTFDLHCMIN